jgi:hypothetical protein
MTDGFFVMVSKTLALQYACLGSLASLGLFSLEALPRTVYPRQLDGLVAHRHILISDTHIPAIRVAENSSNRRDGVNTLFQESLSADNRLHVAASSRLWRGD